MYNISRKFNYEDIKKLLGRLGMTVTSIYTIFDPRWPCIPDYIRLFHVNQCYNHNSLNVNIFNIKALVIQSRIAIYLNPLHYSPHPAKEPGTVPREQMMASRFFFPQQHLVFWHKTHWDNLKYGAFSFPNLFFFSLQTENLNFSYFSEISREILKMYF